MSDNFAFDRELSGKTFLGQIYNVCMVWVADSDCGIINAKTLKSNRGSLVSKKC